LIATLDDLLGRLAARWVGAVQRRAGSTIAAFALSTLAVLAYSFDTLGINTNENDLFSDELPFYALRDDFNRAFPTLVDPIVVVVDGATVDLANDAAEALARRLEREPDRFAKVYRPGGGPFFEQHGFLYLEREELADLLENLFAVQPILAKLSRDAGLPGFLTMLSDSVEASARGDLDSVELDKVLQRVDNTVNAHLAGRSDPLSWSELIMGRDSTPRDRRRFLLVQPVIDFNQLQPAEETLLGLREAVEELGLDRPERARARATGIFPLSYEEMEHVSAQTTWAGVASFVLVAMILVGGLGSPRLVLASLCTLLVGLVWTAGFAAAAIGHLNLVSVAFGVLFIGLSIDFAIHLCVRYRELLASDMPPEQALCDAAGGVGGSLALCATTTAIGFYAFVPTEFAGVAELGAIAGTGMFISLFTNLTLLPALISWGAPPDVSAKRSPSSSRLWSLLDLPVRHARWVVSGTAVITLIAIGLIPSIRFDPNPLRVRDPATDSVQVLNEMLADGDALPWNLNVLAPDLEAAREIAERIEELPSVDVALTLADFVPEHQAEKLEMLEDAAFLLLPTFASNPVATLPTRAEGIATVEGLERSLAALTPDRTSPHLAHTAQQLRQNLARLAESWRADGDPQASLDALGAALTGSLPEQLRLLRAALQAGRVALPDLPADLVERMIATDGRVRIEIFPEGDLNDQPALERYVASVQSIAPDAFGEGLVILETGRAVVRALRQALATAAVMIALLLLLLWRSIADAALVALPLALASIFTAAFSVPLGVSFNFANVIVIPLLLGMGVDTGIHLVHRCRTDAPPDGNLLHTSTARAVLLSAATTMASFGTLGFSSHLGMSSLGRLLVLGIALILACNLVLLPALVRITNRAR